MPHTTTSNYSTAATEFYRELDANDPEVFERRLTTDAVFAFNDIDPVPDETPLPLSSETGRRTSLRLPTKSTALQPIRRTTPPESN